MKAMASGYGSGSIEERNGKFRLVYRANGKKQSVTLPEGTSKTDAKKRLRELLGQVDKGEFVEASTMTLNIWLDRWLDIGAPGQRKEPVSPRTKERYTQLLAEHVRPEIGEKRIQKLDGVLDLDPLWAKLKDKISPWTRRHLSATTQRHVHVVLGSALATAERSGIILHNPMKKAQTKPKKGEVDHGVALDADDLAKLVAGFKGSRFFTIVAVAANTGMRRNELLSLRWTDINFEKQEIRVERALEVTKAGIRFKTPKTERGKRTVDIDAGTAELLLAERSRQQRLMAGIPDGADVSLSMIKLPEGALVFPADLTMTNPTFTKTRIPRDTSKNFRRIARKLGFARMRFHNLRHSHSTILLDAGVPLHRVAARIGDDPATLLRTYAQLTKAKSDKMTDAVNMLGTKLFKT
jgi:integrase